MNINKSSRHVTVQLHSVKFVCPKNEFMSQFTIHTTFQSLQDIYNAVHRRHSIILSDECKEKIKKGRAFVQHKVENTDDVMYGINTGFGSLCNTVVSKEELGQLQKNLMLSHACGTGAEVPKEIVRLMLVLKAKGLAQGHSGVQLATVERLLDFYNKDILPVVYEQGSLGASGDLAPLAHMALPLIGKGEVHYKDQKVSSIEALKSENLSPLEPGAKEGLALLNGTQFMSAYATFILGSFFQLKAHILKTTAISIEAFDCSSSPFDAHVHEVRNHKGQQEVARELRTYLEGSEIIQQKKVYVQDPYSFRCVPQVLGASWDAMGFATQVVEDEINAVTDNPTIFPDEDKVISAGNFHGQPLALQLDFLAIALAEIGSISERRIYQLVNGKRGLPDFLTPDPGLNSGFMIAQYTAASIVSQNKQLTMPSSTDTIESSNGQEDHVSMGANAATKCLRVLNNLQSIIAIELFTAAQALKFRRPLQSSDQLETYYKEFRKYVPNIENDEFMHPHIKAAEKFIRTY